MDNKEYNEHKENRENKDNNCQERNLEKLKNEESTRGLFVKSMLDRIENTIDGDEKVALSMALQYGLDSLYAGEVKKRWL